MFLSVLFSLILVFFQQIFAVYVSTMNLKLIRTWELSREIKKKSRTDSNTVWHLDKWINVVHTILALSVTYEIKCNRKRV